MSRNGRLDRLSDRVNNMAANSNRLPMVCTVHAADQQHPHGTRKYTGDAVTVFLDDLRNVDPHLPPLAPYATVIVMEPDGEDQDDLPPAEITQG